MIYGNKAVGGKRKSFLIIGNGIAGVTAAETLRAEDSGAQITMIASDAQPAYYRPALKDYLAGKVPQEKLWARPASFYQDLRIQCIADQVVAIDGQQHLVWLASGRQMGYGRELLANGAVAHTLCPCRDGACRVKTLRSVADYQTVLGCVRAMCGA